MSWRDHIAQNPEIMLGKPVIKGTRITVEHILMWFGSGWTEADILDSYPHLTAEGIRAALIFASKSQRFAWRSARRKAACGRKHSTENCHVL